jgi:hypothetical protein
MRGDAIDRSDTGTDLGMGDYLPLVRGGSDLEQVIDAPFGRQRENSISRNTLNLRCCFQQNRGRWSELSQYRPFISHFDHENSNPRGARVVF